MIKDALIAAATPTTATKPHRRIVYLTTPKGQRGEFWKAWNDQPWWHKITVTADDIPGVDQAFLAREKMRLGPLFRQEYYCEALAAPGSLFAVDDLAALMIDPVEVEPFPTAEDDLVALW